MDEVTVESLTGNDIPVVMTSDVQRSVDTFSAWLHSENKQPFIVVGPDGCGKGYNSETFDRFEMLTNESFFSDC